MIIAEDLQAKIKAKKKEEQIHIIVKAREETETYVAKVVEKPEVSIRQQLRLVKAFSLALPAGEVEKLATEFWIERIEHDKKVYASLDTSVPLIGIPSLWREDVTGRGVKVAVVDTGIDKFHPDFKRRIIGTADFSLEGFVDLNGHGTHIAGTIAGSGESSMGKYKGVAPEALLLIAKVLKKDGTGRTSDVMAGIEWAAEKRAQVINLSLGSEEPSDGSDILCELCDEVVKKGTTICVAAGNEGPERRTIGSPAAARRVLTVGACSDDDKLAEFSSRGPTLDERMKPDVVAPGVDIIAPRAYEISMGKPLDERYTSATGTSMAAAHVSGAACLFLQAKPDASPLLIREALLHTAKDIGASEFEQGVGRVQVEQGAEYVKTHENPPEIEDAEHLKPGCLTAILDFYHNFTSQSKERKFNHMEEFEKEEEL